MLISKGLWITWENQRRNNGISDALYWKLCCFVYDDKTHIERYIKSIVRTLAVVAEEKPTVIGAQNPSLVLSTLILLMAPIFRYKTVIDAHNAGIYPSKKRYGILLWISKLIQRWADITLVTNIGLKKIVELNRGRAFILPDRIPDVPKVKKIPLEGKCRIAFICTYSDDEPYLEVIKAATTLPDDVIFYITGSHKDRFDTSAVPSNVRLLGFVPEQEYWDLLHSSDFIMDLTTRNDCLVCGAYEGTALAKPLILSDTMATRSLFNQGCVYVRPTANSISEGIACAVENKKRLQEGILQLRSDLKIDFGLKIKSLKEVIRRLP